MTLVEGIVLGVVATKLYKQLPQETKAKLENWAKTHHFEYGLGGVVAGTIIKSPIAVGTGIALMADDWSDKDLAMRNIENKIDSAVNKIKGFLETRFNSSSCGF